MSSAPDGQFSSHHQDARACEIEALADDFLAFTEEFEAALGENRVPPSFADRLAHLLQSAERLI
jgi:hypothetical protein